jgi:hypothetical protein
VTVVCVWVCGWVGGWVDRCTWQCGALGHSLDGTQSLRIVPAPLCSPAGAQVTACSLLTLGYTLDIWMSTVVATHEGPSLLVST